jgi:hypothetical protein
MRPLTVVAWLLICEMAWAAPGAGPLRTLMAKSALSAGWTRSGKADFFDKNTLFNLVDGEAEAYFPYGFKGAVSATYTQGGDKGKEANVELYEMGSLLDAYGIYSSMRDAESKQVDLGAEGFGDTTQIMFYVDKYFVKVRIDSTAAKGELLSFAKAVADVLPADKKKPAQLALVAIPNFVPRSDQYIGQSVLGYACWPKGMIAQIKTKDATARIFVVMTDSPSAAASALDKYVQENAGGTKIKLLVDGGKKVVTLNDPMQGGMAVSPVGKYLIGAANLKDPEKQGIALLEQLRRQVLPAGK